MVKEVHFLSVEWNGMNLTENKLPHKYYRRSREFSHVTRRFIKWGKAG